MAAERNILLKSLETAQAMLAAGDLDKVGDICREVIRHDAENAEAHHILGLIADKTGNPQLAVQLIGKALEKAPNKAVYLNNLGNAHAHLGNHESAIAAYTKAVQIKPSFAEAFNNLGLAHQETGRADKAITCFKKALAANQNLPEVYFNLGSALKDLGFIEPAISAFRQAVTLKENYPRAHYKLGQSLLEEGLLAEALECFKTALYFKPDYTEAQYSLANTYRDNNEPEAALATCRQLLRSKPDFYKVYSHISSLINQGASRPYYTPAGKEILEVEGLLMQESTMAAEDAAHLHFALGDMYDNCDMFAEAFYHYRQGNLIKHAQTDFNMERTTKYVGEIINTFTQEYFADNKLPGSPSVCPVFIVGLPRSGKTLLEKLSATHDRVIRGGELIRLHRLVTVDLPIKLGKKIRFPFYAADIEGSAILEAAREYERVLMSLGGSSYTRVTNTLPYNIFYLGIIAVLFPKAKIIYCKRDGLDNCLAIYFKYFGKGNQFAFDLEEIGLFYGLFSRLIQHWQSVLPLEIYEVSYEKMIAEPEGTTRDLVNFLGLEWNRACINSLGRFMAPIHINQGGLEFKAIHNRFVGRARQYKEFLGPLENRLAGYADRKIAI